MGLFAEMGSYAPNPLGTKSQDWWKIRSCWFDLRRGSGVLAVLRKWFLKYKSHGIDLAT